MSQITLRVSDWMLNDIIGQTHNKSERIKELLMKGHLYEKESLKSDTGFSRNMRESFSPNSTPDFVSYFSMQGIPDNSV